MAGLVPFNKNKSSLKPNGFEDFYNLLDDFFNDTWSPTKSAYHEAFKVDVEENDKEYYITAELPGVKKEEINLELKDGTLLISVKREEHIEEQNKNYIHKERRVSSMQRSIYLADSVAEGIKAKLQDGVLNLTVPKNENVNHHHKINIE